jgi:hypothetical protein
MKPNDYFQERFTKFLTNEWVHLEKKVAALQAEMRLVLGMVSVLVGLIIYLVVNSVI